MVARISTSGDIQKVLNYNEQKVTGGEAVLLDASGFLKDAKDLSYYDKMEQFERHISLNEKVKVNTLHVSLNFDPSEKLSNELMGEIAAEYMDRVGFGYQPYLVYRHQDAGHPHLHIVTTNIQSDGSRISTHNLGRNQSEKARLELEAEYGLVKADGRKALKDEELLKLTASKVVYGKTPTKRAIANVLWPVISQYKYTSLAELNAVLGLYNVAAERGSEGSRVFKNRGLLYRILDDKGNRLGVPVKASHIWFKPTLDYLEKKFEGNTALRQPYRQRLVTAIDWALHGRMLSMDGLKQALRKEQVEVVVRQNKDGVIYGLTYIDVRTRCVFNGSDLGKAHRAKGMMERLHRPVAPVAPEVFPAPVIEPVTGHEKSVGTTDPSDIAVPNIKGGGNAGAGQLVADIMGTDRDATGYVPWQLRKGKKKKKRKGPSL